MKKVLLVTGNYLPYKNGGIENYTHRLAQLLIKNDFGVEVSALNAGDEDSYFYEGIRVYNLKNKFSSFENVLKNGDFDICHFHEYSSYGGIEIHYFKKAKEYCKKVFFTFHLPYLTCYKNDFRYEGKEDCNVFNVPERCAHCVIATKLNEKSNLLKSLSPIIEAGLYVTGKKQKLKRNIIGSHKVLTDILNTCDKVFVIANWFKELLSANGYRQANIELITNSFNSDILLPDSKTRGIKNSLVFVGRIQHQKGLHLLCEAMRLVNNTNLQIDVFGNIVDKEYFEACKNQYQFNYKGIVSRNDLLALLNNYDFLVLPSVFTEMYPMVIQEAFSYKLPVIASSAKGNADVIRNGVNGFLFEYNDSSDLAKKINLGYKELISGWQPLTTSNCEAEEIENLLSYYVN